MACREVDPKAVIRSIDDRKRITLVKGGTNALGKFISISDIGRNGHCFSVMIPNGENAFGWANVAFILQRTFLSSPMGVEVGSPPAVDSKLSSPFLPIAVGDGWLRGITQVSEGRIIHSGRARGSKHDEVWDRMMVCYRQGVATTWSKIARGAICILGAKPSLAWFPVDHRAVFLCSNFEEVEICC